MSLVRPCIPPLDILAQLVELEETVSHVAQGLGAENTVVTYQEQCCCHFVLYNCTNSWLVIYSAYLLLCNLLSIAHNATH